MAYCTVDDLKKILTEAEIVRLTDDSGAGEIVQATVDEAIAGGAVEIDGYIGMRSKLPLTAPYPPLLVRLNADLAIYNLYSRVKLQAPPIWSERRQAATKLLNQFADGKITLGAEAPADPPTSYSSGLRTASRTPDFGPDGLKGY